MTRISITYLTAAIVLAGLTTAEAANTYCHVANTGKYDGYCFVTTYCLLEKSSDCPTGLRAKMVMSTHCSKIGEVRFDTLKPCNFQGRRN